MRAHVSALRVKVGAIDSRFMIDAGISKLFSYDQKFLDRAGTVNVEAVT